MHETESIEKSATKYTVTQTMTTTYYGDNELVITESDVGSSTTFADTALRTHTTSKYNIYSK